MDTGERNKFTGKELFDRHIEEIPTLLDPIFPKKGIILFAGSSDTGKSSFLRDFSVAIAEGRVKFLNYDLNTTSNRVIYYSTEDDDDSVAHLLYKQRERIEDESKLQNITYIFHQNDPIIELEKELRENPADCIIIDALGDILQGNINQTNEVRTYLSTYSALANKYNCLIIFLHHTNKNSEYNLPSKHNISGSHGLESKSRLAVEFRKDRRNYDLRHICIVKGNYLPEEYKNESFVVKFNTDMTYTWLDERVSFSELVSGTENSQREEATNRAIQLRDDGKTIREIAEIITNEGYAVSRSTISNWLNRR